MTESESSTKLKKEKHWNLAFVWQMTVSCIIKILCLFSYWSWKLANQSIRNNSVIVKNGKSKIFHQVFTPSTTKYMSIWEFHVVKCRDGESCCFGYKTYRYDFTVCRGCLNFLLFHAHWTLLLSFQLLYSKFFSFWYIHTNILFVF